MTSPYVLEAAERAARIPRNFRVGQVWANRNGKLRETVMAITSHPLRPVVTQSADGEACAYTLDGQFMDEPSVWDLATLVKDVTGEAVT